MHPVTVQQLASKIVKYTGKGDTMKKYFSLFTIFIAMQFIFCSDPKSVPDEDREMINKITADTMSSMQSGMMKVMMEQVKSSGFAKSVSFCSDFAPEGGKNLNLKLKEKFISEHNIKDFKFRRTSLKYRNPKNAPDSFEEKVLNSWNDDEKSGKKAETYIESVESGYRVLMPIRIPAKTCLGCHGTPETIDAEAAKVIDSLYPEDHAKGFSEGDLRGAISFEITK